MVHLVDKKALRRWNGYIRCWRNTCASLPNQWIGKLRRVKHLHLT